MVGSKPGKITKLCEPFPRCGLMTTLQCMMFKTQFGQPIADSAAAVHCPHRSTHSGGLPACRRTNGVHAETSVRREAPSTRNPSDAYKSSSIYCQGGRAPCCPVTTLPPSRRHSLSLNRRHVRESDQPLVCAFLHDILLAHRPMRVNLPGHHGVIAWSIGGLWYTFKLASSYLLLHVRSGHVGYCMNSYGETYMIRRRHIRNHSTYVPTNRCYAILI